MKKAFLTMLYCGAILLGPQARAQYVLREADAQYELFNYVKAIDLYEQAYQKRQSLHSAERLASCYEMTNNYRQTESWAAIAAGMEGAGPENVLRYAKALQNNSKYAEAKVQYQKYIDLSGKVSASQKSLWLLSCDSAVYWMANPGATMVLNQKSLNSAQSDWGAVKYERTVVFSSDRGTIADSAKKMSRKPFLRFDGSYREPDKQIYGWTGHQYFKLYGQNGGQGGIDAFPVDFGTDYHVGPASFTADGREMYFTLTRMPERPRFVNGKLATINVEIYSSKKGEDGQWERPEPFAYNNVNAYSVSDPCISQDGKILYFSSTLPGGKGGSDLYACFRTEGGGWGKPVNLEEFNTEGEERSPFFDGDRTFYFSSNGWIGMGGLDIFRSVRESGKMAKPMNMGYPINSPQDDFAYNLYEPTAGYLSSNRTDGLGADDIYSFRAQDPILFVLSGVVFNKETKEPLANAIVSLAKMGGSVLKVQTDANGRYKFSLERASDYNLNGDKTSYRSDATKVSTQGLSVSTELKQDLYLEPIVINKAIRIENIYYDFDKSNIRPDAAKELDKLVKIMQDNPTIWIELGSHTDSRGNDQYNQWLSQSRANSAVQYIIDRGIGKNRITAKGYGESMLTNRCANGIACSIAEHQANRRTEFKIVKQ